VLAAAGVADPASNRLRLAARGWVAFTEEATLEWLSEGEPGRSELVDLLEEALVALMAVATRLEATARGG
jgi:hypothetical protein